MQSKKPSPILKVIDSVSVQVYNNQTLLGEAAAKKVADVLTAAIIKRGQANIIFATGNSQLEFLAVLRQNQNLPWSKVSAFHLDEYIGISEQHPASFRSYLQKRILNYLPFGNIYLIEGDAPEPSQEVRRYESLLIDKKIDIACVGIGENGHLAFNDPPADFSSPSLAHIVELDERCRRQQVSEGHFQAIEDVPQHAISLTVPAILSADVIVCIVPELRKAVAVRDALLGPVSPQCPASALRKHGEVHMFLDLESSSLLSDS